MQVVEAATGHSVEAADTGANREIGGGAKGRTGSGSGWQEAKRQARNVDPGMESVRTETVAGERKVVASIRSRSGERLRRAIEALIRWLTKSAVGKQRSEASGAPECDVQSGAGPR